MNRDGQQKRFHRRCGSGCATYGTWRNKSRSDRKETGGAESGRDSGVGGVSGMVLGHPFYVEKCRLNSLASIAVRRR